MGWGEPEGGGRRHNDVYLEEFLRRQAGVVTSAQAVQAGLSPDAIRRRARSGAWHRIHPGVYLPADRAFTDEARVRAAVLGAGPGAAAHGCTAAWWHHLTANAPPVVEVTVPRQRFARQLDGVRIRRRDLSHLDLVGLRDLWLTEVALTVLESAVALGPDGPALLDRALQRRVRFAALHRAQCRNLGRSGSPQAGQLLAAASDRAGSQAERILIRLLKKAGIGGWRLHRWHLGYELDLSFARERVVIEVDGWAWHVDRDRFQADRVRQNALVNDGWRVLRFTWHDLTTRPGAVINEVRTALHPPVIAVSA